MFLKKLFSKKDKKKSVAIYISETHSQIIIAPRYINNDGIMYEQESCSIISFPIDHSAFGNEVTRNINLFAIKDKNLRNGKLTDWPAFKCSKLKTVKSFKESYTLITVSGVNESNITFSIEAPVIIDADLSIISYISGYADKVLISDRIIKVYKTCRLKSIPN